MTMEEKTPSAVFDPATATAPPTSTPPPSSDPQNATQAAERAQVAQSEARGEEPAARTDPNAGPGGMSLGTNDDGSARREIGGGAITRELKPDPPSDATVDALYFHRRYMSSRLAKEAGNIIGRAPENIGFWGRGMTYRGNGGILVNIDTLEKVRVQDGYKFTGDEVFANSRDLPHALVDGDVQKNLSGEAAQMMAERAPVSATSATATPATATPAVPSEPRG